MIVTLKALQRLGLDPASTRVVIQGFGNGGGMAARLMSQAGFKMYLSWSTTRCLQSARPQHRSAPQASQ